MKQMLQYIMEWYCIQYKTCNQQYRNSIQQHILAKLYD